MDEDTIDIKETKERLGKVLSHLKNRLKDPRFWIDNIILIALIIIVTYFGIKGHYLDVKVVEVCNGVQMHDTTPLLELIK